MTRARDLAAGTFELATGGVLKLETSDTTVTDGSVLGKIEFKAPDEASGTDAILVGAAIEAVAEGTFAADNNATEFVFKTGASAAADAKMTLTSGGELLVGKTVADNTTVGARILNTGRMTLVASANDVLTLNRTTSDGDIVAFRKAGTTVGSIGVISSNNLIIANPSTNHSGVVFGTNTILPALEDDYADGLVDFGNSSERFRDIYLSGGVYLGGTGAANKLDDYEFGTWTPTLPNGGTVGTISKAVYTKVGNLVNAFCNVYLNPTNNSTQFKIGGLPFAGVSSNHGGGTLSYTGGMETRYWSAPLVDTGSAVYFHRHDASTGVVLNNAFGGANRQFIMQLTYTLA